MTRERARRRDRREPVVHGVADEVLRRSGRWTWPRTRRTWSARNQKSDERTARRMTPGSAGSVRAARQSRSAPHGRARPRRTGRRGARTSTGERPAATLAPASSATATRQPASDRKAGRAAGRRSAGLRSCSPRTPRSTMPRPRTNQRFAMVGPDDARDEARFRGPTRARRTRATCQMLAGQRGCHECDCRDHERRERDRPDAEPCHQRARTRAPDRPNTRSPIAAARRQAGRGPPWLGFHRDEQRAGRRAHPRRRQQNDGRDGDDDPTVEERSAPKHRAAGGHQAGPQPIRSRREVHAPP